MIVRGRGRIGDQAALDDLEIEDPAAGEAHVKPLVAVKKEHPARVAENGSADVWDKVLLRKPCGNESCSGSDPRDVEPEGAHVVEVVLKGKDDVARRAPKEDGPRERQHHSWVGHERY